MTENVGDLMSVYFLSLLLYTKMIYGLMEGGHE